MEKKNDNNNVTFKKEEERIENVENMNSSINFNFTSFFPSIQF